MPPDSSQHQTLQPACQYVDNQLMDQSSNSSPLSLFHLFWDSLTKYKY